MTTTKKAIVVNCECTEMQPTESLAPNPRNPNKHPEYQVRLLAKILSETGWRAPITVSNQTGLIVRGHGRLEAAKYLGLAEVPVDRQDYDSEEAEWADLIADNRIADLAELDKGILRDVLGEIDTGAFDMERTGFTFEDLEALMTALPPFIDNGDMDSDRTYRLATSQSKQVVNIGRMVAVVPNEFVDPIKAFIRAEFPEESSDPNANDTASLLRFCEWLTGEHGVYDETVRSDDPREPSDG